MKHTPLRIAFMGTPDFAVAAFEALVKEAQAAGHTIAAVYTQPPRPAGRGHKLHPSPVQRRAEELGLPVRHPKTLKKSADAQKDFAELELDLAVVAAYGLILPKAVLDAPRFGCINIHASLLPRWRGAAPIQRAILAGDDESGVCIMQMEEGLDTGPVLMRAATPITAQTTAQSLHDALSTLGAELAVETVRALSAGERLVPQPQPADGATYAHMLTKDDGRVNWASSAEDIERRVRALTPWPGVWCLCNGQRLKLLDVCVSARQGLKGAAGEIVQDGMTVMCGTGALEILRVQPQDRKPMDGASFMNGGHARAGDVLT